MGRMDKDFIKEIGAINALSEAEYAIALANKYNLEVIVMREGGKGRMEGVIPRIRIYRQSDHISQVLIYKGEIRPVTHLGLYNGSRATKVKALRTDLEKNTYEVVNEERVEKVEDILRGYKIMLKGKVEGQEQEGVYELERAVSNYYKVKGEKGKMYRVEDVRLQKI